MKKYMIAIYWFLAVLLTLSASVYQRMTGPTNPFREKINIDNTEFKLKLPRSAENIDKEVILNIDKEVDAYIYYRKYPSNDEFTEIKFNKKDKKYIATLPVQPPAGKLEYYIQIDDKTLFKEEPLIIRFKDSVPSWALIPHIIFMFAAMLFANYGLIMTFVSKDRFKKYLLISTALLVIGGFIFGPIVQKFAFGVYWSGFPLGYDLTDNKTLIALIGLIISIAFIKKKYSRYIAMLGFILMIGIFCIPHSLRGSELNHQTGVVGTAR